jgi:hypothetical protein
VITAVIAAIAVLAVGGLLAYKYVFAKSDADQVKALVQAVTADQNKADAAGLLTLSCSAASFLKESGSWKVCPADE